MSGEARAKPCRSRETRLNGARVAAPRSARGCADHSRCDTVPRHMSFLRGLILGLSLVLASVSPVVAQASSEREIAGVVTNAETHALVSGATVAAGDRRTVTDRDGRFRLRVPQ